jgi:predicted nucleic acid-binding protein
LAKRYNLDVVRIFTSVMSLCNIEDERALKAAIYIRDHNLRVFDAFHAAYCEGKIISPDSAYERVGIERVKLEEGLN